MQTYKAIQGQSLLDVCLNTYGSLDYLFKLIQDNGIINVAAPVAGLAIIWDDSLVLNQAINQNFSSAGIKYATDISNNGSVFYVSQGGTGFTPPSYYSPANPAPTVSQVVYNTNYTSNADGVTVVTINDLNNNPIIGFKILQVTDEIKQLKPSEYSWNPNTAQLTLLGGKTIDNNQTLFILYSTT